MLVEDFSYLEIKCQKLLHTEKNKDLIFMTRKKGILVIQSSREVYF